METNIQKMKRVIVVIDKPTSRQAEHVNLLLFPGFSNSIEYNIQSGCNYIELFYSAN